MYAYQYPRPRRKRATRRSFLFGDGVRGFSDFDDDDDQRQYSGHGTIEFTPDKAGQDITPANLDFVSRDEKRPSVKHSISDAIESVTNLTSAMFGGSTTTKMRSRGHSPPPNTKGSSAQDLRVEIWTRPVTLMRSSTSLKHFKEKPLSGTADQVSGSGSTSSHASRKMAVLVSPSQGPSGVTPHTLLDDEEEGAEGDVDEDDEVERGNGTTPCRSRSRLSKSSQGRLTTTSSAPQTSTSGHKSTSSSMTIPLSCSSSNAQTPGDELSPDRPMLCDQSSDDLCKLEVRIDDLSKQVQNLEDKISSEMQSLIQLLNQVIVMKCLPPAETSAPPFIPATTTAASSGIDLPLHMMSFRSSSVQLPLSEKTRVRVYRRAVSLQGTPVPADSSVRQLSGRGSRSQEELVDDIPEAIAEEPVHTHSHAKTVPPSPVVEDTPQPPERCRSQPSYFNQTKSKSAESGPSEKIELQPLTTQCSKKESPSSPDQGVKESLPVGEETSESPVVEFLESSSKAEARSRSVEDLPKKPKTYLFRDSKSSDV
ncbi:hypothetical protein X975_11992, partial [Stegodyphus mimosarum]